MRCLLGKETDVENWRVGSTNVHFTEGQGLCAVCGVRRVRNLLALKHLGVGGWETEKKSGLLEFFSSVRAKKNDEIRVASMGWHT